MAQTASPADITAVSNILKKVYPSDEIVSQLNDDALLYSQIQRTQEYHDAVGDKAVLFTKVGRNVGTSSRSLNGGTLGAAGHQRTQKLEYDYTAHYIQLKLLGTTIAKMSTARQAAIRTIDLEVNGALTDIKKDRQRQIYGDGTGVIATCGTTTTSTTLNLSTAVTTTGGATTVYNNNDAIRNGWLDGSTGEPLYVDIGTLAAPTTVGGDLQVTGSTDSDTAPALTMAASLSTTANTHFVFKAGNQAASSVSYESNGLENLVAASGSFGGLATSSEASWAAAKVVDAAGASLSRSHMQQAYRAVRRFGKPNFILTSFEHQEDYYNLLQSQVRFASDSNLASGNVDGPQFNNLPVSADADCPRGRMYFLDKSHLFMVSAGAIDWQNMTTGGDKLVWVQGEDSYVAMAKVYEQLGTDKRRAHAKVKNLAINA
jgi:hypothetical protein